MSMNVQFQSNKIVFQKYNFEKGNCLRAIKVKCKLLLFEAGVLKDLLKLYNFKWFNASIK